MAANTTWTPPAGRHQVGMGGSMTRFFRQRKGLPAPAKQTKPVSSYFHFKYNFMPESVDNTKPGVIEVSQGAGITNVKVERASHQADEAHIFRGKEEPAKDVECVLIYDEETGIFTLEKLDSSLFLNHEGRGAAKARVPSDSPPHPTPSPATSAPKLEQDDLAAELDRELLTTLDDAEGEPDDEVPLAAAFAAAAEARAAVMPPSAPAVPRKNEPLRPPPVDMSSGKPRPKLRGASSKPPTAMPAPVTPVTALPVYAPPSSPKTKNVHTLEIEEEELEFGQPTRVTKRARISPPMPSSDSFLALPTAGGAAALAPPPFMPPAPPSSVPQDEDDDDDDDVEWDQVAGMEDIFGVEGDGEGDGEGEEINLDMLAAEVDQELGGLPDEEYGEQEEAEEEEEEEEDGDEDEDEEMFGTYEEPPRLGDGQGPISLNQYAGGAPVGGAMDDDDEDDYSSSSSDSDSD